MKKLMDAMRVSVLFEGIKETELESLVENGGARVQAFQKDQFLIHQGDKAKGVGLVLEGRLHILREDFLGNREILAEVTAGDIFDEVYAVLQNEPQSVAVAAASDGQAAFFSTERLLENREVMGNMIKVLARKNLFLTREDVPSFAENHQGEADLLSVGRRQQTGKLPTYTFLLTGSSWRIICPVEAQRVVRMLSKEGRRDDLVLQRPFFVVQYK